MGKIRKIKKIRIGQGAKHIWYITHWNNSNFTCEKKYFDLFEKEYYI